MIIYHGSDINNLKNLLNEFKILTPEEKMKFPSTGGGNVGLSASRDKTLAKRYSQAFGNDKVLSIFVDPAANILQIDTNGDGIDSFMYGENGFKEELKQYDAIMEIDDAAEKEIRILNADRFTPIKLESITPLETFIESIDLNENLRDIVNVGYSVIFEEITKPMEYLKSYMKPQKKSAEGHVLEPYMKARKKEVSDAETDFEMASEHAWHRIVEIINDEMGLNLNTEDFFWENEEENKKALVAFMNEHPNVANAAIERYNDDEPGMTKNTMDYRHPLINKWLVHYSDNGWDIFREGFKYGNEDMTNIGLTNAGSTKGKQHGDYLFAYDIDDAVRYGSSTHKGTGKFKYGEIAIVFIASGIEFYHYGDEEPQVVFDKKTPKGCFLIEKDDLEYDDPRDYKFVIYGHAGKNGHQALASKENMKEALDWCQTNFRQYQNFYYWRK